MSFCQAGDLLQCLRLCRIASILIQKMGPMDLEGGQQGEWGALLVRNKKTQYQTHYGAVKISFRRAGNLKRYILNSNGKPSVSKDTTSWGGHTQTTMQTVKSRQSYQGTTQINSEQIKQSNSWLMWTVSLEALQLGCKQGHKSDSTWKNQY